MKSIYCPSVNSTFSCRSVPSSEATITKGQLQCLQKSGMLCFIFSVDDDASQVMYMANSQKIESSTEDAIDCLYSFYFKDTKKNNSRSRSSISTNLIAKMKVSSSIVLKPNCVKVMETEFVLYGSHEKLSNELQKSFSVVSRSKGFRKKLAETLRPSNMRKNKVNGQKLNGVGHINVSSLVNDSINGFLPNLELAAIVVEECLQDTTSDLIFNGWGLKFLEKACHKDKSSEPLFSHCHRRNPDESARSMHVLVPAGPHGGQITQTGGATSLIGRWKSGGHCDCGGWDLGCPLKVLSYSSIYSNVSPEDTEKKSLNLFMEGTRNGGDPILSMMKMAEGFYSICFKSTLSALQSFSVAVAAIHTKINEKI